MVLRWLILTILLTLLSACATASKYTASRDMNADEAAFGSPAASGRPANIGVELTRAKNVDLQAGVVSGEPDTSRQVHHEGSIRLRATQPRQVLEQATEWTRDAGGYVESLTAQHVVLQIPAPRFRALYAQILGLGDVVNKTLAARDVTEEFHDADLRLSQAKATRDRLLALIEKAASQKEKLRLLREVERLTADIEFLEAQLARLQTLVAYSQLTLSVEGRKNFGESPLKELRGFEWVDSLGPENRGGGREVGKFSLAVPLGFVDLEESALWSAVSPDGAAVWTQKRQNEPTGDTKFWLDAVRWRLKDRFAQIEEKLLGEFSLLRCLSREDPRFVYWVGVLAKDDRLFVVQAYFPSLNLEQSYDAAVAASLRGGVK